MLARMAEAVAAAAAGCEVEAAAAVAMGCMVGCLAVKMAEEDSVVVVNAVVAAAGLAAEVVVVTEETMETARVGANWEADLAGRTAKVEGGAGVVLADWVDLGVETARAEVGG